MRKCEVSTDKEHKRQLDIWECGHFQNPAHFSMQKYHRIWSEWLVGWSVGRLICVCNNTRNHTSLSQSTFNKWICVLYMHVHRHHTFMCIQMEKEFFTIQFPLADLVCVRMCAAFFLVQPIKQKSCSIWNFTFN